MAQKQKQKYTSNGERKNVSRKITAAARRNYLKSPERIINQQEAFHSGKRVMVTIENPNKEQTNKRFIRVDASTIWKKPEGFIIP